MIMKKNGKAALDLRRDIPQCLDASHLHVSDILSNFNSIVMSWNECQMEYSKMKDDNREMGGDASPGLHRLGSFIGRSTSTIARLNMSKEDALNGCRVSTYYYFFQLISQFNSELRLQFHSHILITLETHQLLRRKRNRSFCNFNPNIINIIHQKY